MKAGAWILLVAAALACAEPVCAAVSHRPARHHASGRHKRFATRRVRHLSMEMKDDHLVANWRPSSRQAQRGPMLTNLQGRIGKTRAIATLGYNKDAVGPPVRREELNGAAEPQLGRPESTAGVSVKIPF